MAPRSSPTSTAEISSNVNGSSQKSQNDTIPNRKSVLVTGCTEGGIGDAIAKEFHRQGFLVFATARDLSHLEHLKELGYVLLKLDVTDEASVRGAVETVELATGGTLDILVNNAGVVYSSTVLDISIPVAKDSFNVHVFGVISMVQHFSPLLIRSQGTIVTVGSMSAYMRTPYNTVYGGSKAAAESLSHCLRVEMKPLGVKVVHITGGCVHTPELNHRPKEAVVPSNSLYFPIKETADHFMSCKDLTKIPAPEFAQKVVKQVLKSNPKSVVYEGGMIGLVTIMRMVESIFGTRLWDMMVEMQPTGLKELRKIREGGNRDSSAFQFDITL